MKAKATRMFFAAVALTAFAALLAGTAQARIPEGNGTQPPSGKVVDENALASMLASSAQASRPEGNGTQPPPGAVVREQKLSQQKSVVEKLGEIGAWAVPSTSQHKPQLLRHTNKLGEIGAWAVPSTSQHKAQLLRHTNKLGEIGAWATLPATKSAIIARG
jgi:hypothetical protein